MIEVFRRTGLESAADGLAEPWYTPRSEETTRASEIDTWLDGYAAGGRPSFVVLDDLVSGKSLKGSSLEGRTVFYEAWKGLTHPKLRTAQGTGRQTV